MKPTSKVFADEPIEALTGKDYEPPNLAKLDSALGALHAQMAAESDWVKICIPLANEARRFEVERPNDSSITEELYTLLDEHSKEAAEELKTNNYHEMSNRDYFDRIIREYDKKAQQGEKQAFSGSIYIQAEQQGWVWIDPTVTPGVSVSSLKFQADEAGIWEPIRGGVYEASDETLASFNERWRYIKSGGKTLLYEYKVAEGWMLSDDVSMKADLANVMVCVELGDGKSKYEGAAKWFIHHHNRLPPANKVFKPNGKINVNEINFWQGWGIIPDFSYKDDLGKPKPQIALINGFIWEVICKKDKNKLKSFIYLHAWIVQNPGKPPGVFPVLKSIHRGSGKNTFAKIMLKIFGKHGMLFLDKEHFFGKHAVYEYLCYAVLDELLAEKGHKTNDLIKGRATSGTIIVEPKYFQAKEAPNTVAMLILSNHKDPVSSGPSERRQLVLELDQKYVGNKQYFKDLHDAIDSGGAEQFFGFLLSVNLNGWSPNEIIKTAELAEQQINSLSPVEHWLLDVADADCMLGGIYHNKPLNNVYAEHALRKAFFEHTKGTTAYKMSNRAFGNIIVRYIGPRVKCNTQSIDGNNPDMGYFVPNGTTLRDKIYKEAGIAL